MGFDFNMGRLLGMPPTICVQIFIVYFVLYVDQGDIYGDLTPLILPLFDACMLEVQNKV
jgi:hypothetical protein